MKTRFGIIFGMVCGLLIAVAMLWAADYSTYTTDELAALRGTLRNASEQEREAFRAERQERLQNMTPEERQEYLGPPENRPADGQGDKLNAPQSGYGQNQQAGGGGGRGRGFGGGRGKGGGKCKGRNTR